MKIVDGHFELNGEKFHIYSGAIHYFRIMPEYWRDRLLKLKAAGFNTVETYIPWNLNEKRKGEFDFSGRLDIEKFLSIAQEVGLYAIVRPGPYICAEWDLGGLPAWLIKETKNIRCMDEVYTRHVKDYFTELFKHLVNHQLSHGGNIIMMQVENEYGNYGADHNYMEWLRDIMINLGCDCLLCTSDDKNKRALSSGMIDNVYATINFGSKAKDAFDDLALFNRNEPKMVMEFWCGWFDHWGEKHHTKKAKWVAKQVSDLIDMDANFNFYVFNGGTNFGFTSGANTYLKYTATVTSYDYAAPLTEWGDYTKQYYMVRDVMKNKLHLDLPELPPRPTLQNIGEVDLEVVGSLFGNLDNLATKRRVIYPEPMEMYDQASGLIYYEVEVNGKYSPVIFSIKGLHDYAYIYRDHKFVKKVKNNIKNLPTKILKEPTVLLKEIDGKVTLGVLVDNDGHVNFGNHITDMKGITGLEIVPSNLYNMDVYNIPLDNIGNIKENDDLTFPLFLRGKFKASSKDDCFVHFDGFSKGIIYVNGFNLGRYNKIGPQKTLYLPGCILKDENEIVILELEGYKKPIITINDKPKLG
ncbi:MAG: beta-galactosidase [Bacilli bacterium]|nr:beta-galactosidase [Bacilli bacterium]